LTEKLDKLTQERNELQITKEVNASEHSSFKKELENENKELKMKI